MSVSVIAMFAIIHTHSYTQAYRLVRRWSASGMLRRTLRSCSRSISATAMPVACGSYTATSSQSPSAPQPNRLTPDGRTALARNDGACRVATNSPESLTHGIYHHAGGFAGGRPSRSGAGRCVCNARTPHSLSYGETVCNRPTCGIDAGTQGERHGYGGLRPHLQLRNDLAPGVHDQRVAVAGALLVVLPRLRRGDHEALRSMPGAPSGS